MRKREEEEKLMYCLEDAEERGKWKREKVLKYRGEREMF